MLRGAFIGLPLALLACGPTPVDLIVPTTEEVRSLVMSWEYDNIVAARAYDLRTSETARYLSLDDVPSGVPVDVTALLYADRLENYDLKAGTIQPAPASAKQRRVPFETGFRIRIDGTSAGSWTSIDSPQGGLRNFMIEASTPCIEFDTQTIALPTKGDLANLIPIDDDTVLAVVGARGRTEADTIFFEVTTGGEVTEVGRIQNFASRAAARMPDGQIAIGGRCFQAPCPFTIGGGFNVFIGDPNTSRFEEVPARRNASTSFKNIKRMAVETSGANAGAIYTMAFGGAFERYFDGAWTVLADASGPGDEPEGGAVIVVGPDEAYAADRQIPLVYHYVDGRVIEEPLPELSGSPSALLNHAQLGVVVGGTEGQLHRFEEGRWGVIGDPLTSSTVVGLAPMPGGGIAYFGFFGGLLQYYPDFGYCPDTPIIATLATFSIVETGDAFLIGGNRLSVGAGTLSDVHLVLMTTR